MPLGGKGGLLGPSILARRSGATGGELRGTATEGLQEIAEKKRCFVTFEDVKTSSKLPEGDDHVKNEGV